MIRVTFLCLILAGCSLSFGAEEDTGPDAESPVIRQPIERIDSTHTTVSDMLEATAKRIDRFFADDRAFEESNDTTLQISLDMISEENSLIEFDSRVRTRLALPGTERRLRLIIESDPEEIDPNAPENDPIDALDSSSNFIIGVEGERMRGGWQLRPSLGIKPRWTPEPYARLRAIRYFNLDQWLARVSATAAWFSSDGKSLAGTTDFDRRLTDQLLFRSASSARWEIDDTVTSASQVFTLFHKLASKAKLAYDIGVVGDDDPNWRVTDHFIRLRYRRLVYKSWAYVEIQPRASWPEDNDYHEELSLLLRLEVNFGSDFR
jgi:hypothetical protein